MTGFGSPNAKSTLDKGASSTVNEPVITLSDSLVSSIAFPVSAVKVTVYCPIGQRSPK